MTTNNTFAGFNLDKIYEEDQERLRQEAEKAKLEQQKQALKDKLADKLAGKNKPDEAEVHTPKTPVTPLVPSMMSTNDVFGIADIVKSPDGNYEFIGLEIPGGLWDKITLSGAQYEGGAKKTYQDWITHSNNQTPSLLGSAINKLTGSHQTEYRITPARVRYWSAPLFLDTELANI